MASEKYVYDFDEPSDGGRELLGGKGVGLAEMTSLGVPVPAGFTVTTDACRAYMANTSRRSRSGPASASATPRIRCLSPSARARPYRCPG
jgi:phosphoenolpyruvate synthase/pyruvate phosphate dikinase